MSKEPEEIFYYTSIYDLPLYNFVRISLGDDAEKLLVKPETWQKILLQYSSASGDKNIEHLFILARDIVYLSNRLKIIDTIVAQLTTRRIDGLVELLKNDLGFNFEFVDLDVDLKRVISKSKSEVIKLKLAQTQYDEMQNTKGDSATEESWADEISVLSKFQGYTIKQKDITVGEYLSIKKAYVREIDRVRRAAKPN